MSSASELSSEFDETHSWRRPPIVLTAADRDCLLALIFDMAAKADTENIRFLREELARAEIAPDDVAPKLVVKMGSRVKFVDHADERMHRATLVYPDEAGGDDCVSILTSVGTALIGLGPGQSIRWTEQGAERSLAVLEVAGGDTNHRARKEGTDDAHVQSRRSRKLEFRGGACRRNDQESPSEGPKVQRIHSSRVSG